MRTTSTSGSRRASAIGAVLVLLALMLGLGSATIAATASPAHAGTGGSYQICLPILNSQGQVVGWTCVPFVEGTPDPRPCDDCPWLAIGLEHLVLPDDFLYPRDMVAGLQLLGQAATAPPREAAWLRDRAQQSFLAAAERLGEGQVALGETGKIDRRSNRIEPVPDPWLEEAGTSLVNGLALTQRALADPDPQPWLEEAMAQFGAALETMSHRAP